MANLMHLFTFKKVKCGLPGAFNRDIYDPDLSYFLPTVFADHLYIQKYETDIRAFTALCLLEDCLEIHI